MLGLRAADVNSFSEIAGSWRPGGSRSCARQPCKEDFGGPAFPAPSGRYVQFMDQGKYGMRMESVSDYSLPEDDHLTGDDFRYLMKPGWHAPTLLPG